MTEPSHCATCGALLSESLAGKCPVCLLKAGLTDGSVDSSDITNLTTMPYPTPPVVEEPRRASAPRLGQSFGTYQIIRALGQGGMGSVFEAEELETGRRLALKLLHNSLDSPDARQRFLREGKLAASVNHPNTVYVYGAEEIEGAPVITMELVEGGTLQDRVRKAGPMPVQRAVDAALQVVDGLEAAQAVDVLHRDVKPANCFLDAAGGVKVGDFGLSIDPHGRSDLKITSSGVFLGTPAYASPEQLRGDELDFRSDQYAVGVTLYYILTGSVPFEASSLGQLIAKVIEKPAPDVRLLRPEVPRELSAVIQRCLAKDRSRRYRTYADLHAALLPFSSLVPTPGAPLFRVAADFIDKTVLIALGSVLAVVLSLLGLRASFANQALEPVMWWATLVLYVLYSVVPEGWVGATLGKRLLRLRVVHKDTSQPPGLVRAGLRGLMFQYVPAVPSALFLLAHPEVIGQSGWSEMTGSFFEWFMLASLGYFVILGLLFVPMRRGNGYAGLHDLLTGCRVITRPATTARPALQTRFAGELPSTSTDSSVSTQATVGPFQVLGNLDGEWRLGHDNRLRRKVWLQDVAAATPKVTPARQKVSRAGRLRWLAGRRSPGENWDAFQAPSGQALVQLLDRPHDWGEVRFWLLDLAYELAAALKDETLPERLGLDQVWITTEGRAILLDQPRPGALADAATPVEGTDGVKKARELLYLVAVAALHGRCLQPAEARDLDFKLPLPLAVRPVVEEIEKGQSLEAVAAQIRAGLAKPTRVTRGRRAALLACCLGIPLLFLIPVLVQAASDANSVASVESIDLFNALNWHTPFLAILQPDEEERKALEVYLAGMHRERIKDPASWSSPPLSGALPHQKEAALDIANMPTPTPEELKKARAAVELRLVAQRGLIGLEGVEFAQYLLLIFLVFFVVLIVLPSLVCTPMFRGGLLWRLFRIAAVTRDGRPAWRWRLFVRTLIAWSPLLLAPCILGVLVSVFDGPFLPTAIVLLGYLALTLVSSLYPTRSWPDRLSGTWLVIR